MWAIEVIGPSWSFQADAFRNWKPTVWYRMTANHSMKTNGTMMANVFAQMIDLSGRLTSPAMKAIE